MTYYLISEENQYSICFVKDEDSAGFHYRCGHKILLHGCNILKLLSLLDEKLVKEYSFTDN